MSELFGRRVGLVRTVAVLASTLVALVTAATAATVHAHAGLAAASPAPGAIVGGDIREIQLRYASTVADVDGSVTDPNGDLVESVWVQESNLRIAVQLSDPLSVPGEYAVRHTSTDVEDGDRVEAAYLFSYDPAAPPPILEIIPQDDGFPWVWIIVGAGGLVLGVLAWRLGGSIRRAHAIQNAARQTVGDDSQVS